ncbi:MAG: hypothetical protein J6V24_07725, partial [Clostridia bacterium]|nr:hypothetical protein [Clostridia bacterium]
RDPGDVRDYYDNLLVRYIPDDPASELTLVSEDDETFTFTADGPYYENDDGVGGMCTTTFTVAKDTLAILSCSWAYENGYIGGAFTVTYNGEKAGEDVMKAWDRTRRLDIDIRTEAGEPRVDSVEIPDSWLVQLLADELITVYFDEACTEPTYNLLDAGGDLTLWARDEANTPLTPAPGGTDLPADLPGFAVEDIIDANYLTVLLPQYGQVKINQTYDYGSDYVCYFPFRDTVAYYGEGRYVFDGEDENTRFGSDGDISYDIAEDGTVSGYAYADTASGEDYIAYNSDAEGRFFPDNAYLSSSLYGCVITDIEERDDAFVIHTGYAETAEGEDPVVQTYTVDRETLAIRSYAVEGADYSLTVEYGEGLNPYEDAFRTAMADTRTVTYHIRMDGETFDRVYEVPKSWTFSLRVKEDMRFFKDKGLTDPTENLIPADQWNHEIWVTDARG